MYKYILQNKLIFLSIGAIITFYILLKNKQPLQYHEKIKPLDLSVSNVSSKILDNEVITKQLNQSNEKDKQNFLIDNNIINGMIELPKVEYSDPSIDNLNFIDEKKEESFEKYTKGSVVFNQTLVKHPSNKECFNYTCMPGSYNQCSNNVYSNNNQECNCRANFVCKK